MSVGKNNEITFHLLFINNQKVPVLGGTMVRKPSMRKIHLPGIPQLDSVVSSSKSEADLEYGNCS